MTTDTKDPTVSELLLAAGYTHKPSEYHGMHDVFDSTGRVVFTGDGAQAARWLREQVSPTTPAPAVGLKAQQAGFDEATYWQRHSGRRPSPIAELATEAVHFTLETLRKEGLTHAESVTLLRAAFVAGLVRGGMKTRAQGVEVLTRWGFAPDEVLVVLPENIETARFANEGQG
jgi:hypothetical protein